MSSQLNHCLVINSSVIIALAEISMAGIIGVFSVEVIVPHAVYEEVAVKGRGKPGSKELETLISQSKVKVFSSA